MFCSFDSFYKVKLVLESSSRQHIEEAFDFLLTNLPQGLCKYLQVVLSEHTIYSIEAIPSTWPSTWSSGQDVGVQSVRLKVRLLF